MTWLLRCSYVSYRKLTIVADTPELLSLNHETVDEHPSHDDIVGIEKDVSYSVTFDIERILRLSMKCLIEVYSEICGWVEVKMCVLSSRSIVA